MKSVEQTTFWQFTVENAKEAVRLYFQPVRQIGAWLGNESDSIDPRGLERRVQQLRQEQEDQKEIVVDRLRQLSQNQDALDARLRDLEQQLYPPFDSVENLNLRVNRLTAWLGSAAGSAVEEDVKNAANDLASQLAAISLWAASPHNEAERERSLAYIRNKLRQIEVYLGFEQPLHTRKAQRTRGATGD